MPPISMLRRACALCAFCAGLSGCTPHARDAADAGAAAERPGPAAVARIVDLATVPGNTFDVRYKPQTVRISAESTYRSFVGMTADGAVYAFDANEPAVAALTPGSVVLFSNFALVKVDDVDTRDGFTLLHVEPAALTDAIEHADIAFTSHVDFGGAVAAAPRDPITAVLEAGATPALAAAGGPAGVSYAREGDQDGWHYRASAARNGSRLDIALALDKTIGETTLNVRGAGYVEHFDTAGAMRIDRGVMEKFGFSTKNLAGEMDIDWTAKKNDKATVTTEKDKPPKSTKAFFTFPMFMGGIPFTLSINAKYLVRPAMSGSDEISHSAFHVAYNGTTGFSVQKDTVSPDGSIAATQHITAATAVSLAPMGMVVGVAMPRFSFGLNPSDAMELLQSAVEGAGVAQQAEKAGPSLSGRLREATEALKKSTFVDKISTKLGSFVRHTNSGDGVVQDLSTGAEAYIEAIFVGTVTHAGETGMVPCTRSTLDTAFKLGVSVSLFGQEVTESKTPPLFDQEIDRAEPDVPVCHTAGTRVGE